LPISLALFEKDTLRGLKIFKTEDKMENVKILENRNFAWFVIAVSLMASIIDNFLKMPMLVGGWHIVLYLLLLSPIIYLVFTKKVANPYVKYFIPLGLVMIADMFIYNNDFVQYFLPIIFYIFIALLYLGSMQKVEFLYQTFIPKFAIKFKFLTYIKELIVELFGKKIDKNIYNRVIYGFLITVPFLGIFTLLFINADSQYKELLNSLSKFNFNFEFHYLITLPLIFLIYLSLYIYSFLNSSVRTESSDKVDADKLIIGIFLGAINLLFISFLALQIPFLIFDTVPKNINIANFAREGFFQLMVALTLVVAIFLFISKRYKSDKLIAILLSALLIQSITLGIVSLKKMHLYQELKGATVLRYYVEWFDYFLIIFLILGVIFTIRKISFYKLLNIIAVAGLLSLTLIASINIDYLVAKTNIEKFKNIPDKLDIHTLKMLSIDAVPAVEKLDAKLRDKILFSIGADGKKVFNYKLPMRKNCSTFSTYHYGYCSIKR